MPESRDRLSRPVDYAAVFFRRRNDGVLLDESDSSLGWFGSPVRRFPPATNAGVTRVTAGQGSMLRGGRLGSGSFGILSPGSGRGQSPARLRPGRENTPVGTAGRGRARGTTGTIALPSWYPRTPLHDITAVVTAIERRQARLGEVDGRESETPISLRARALVSPVPLSGAQLEHKNSMVTPNPAVRIKHRPLSTAKVHKMLLDITKQTSGQAEFLTPQRMLLNSIDKVEKVVTEELQKLKRTPSAKREEREKRVRTLMSMR